MEKENKKLRDAERKKRNETVRVRDLFVAVFVFPFQCHLTTLNAAIGGFCSQEGQESGGLQGL